jgi:hypothetical protein
MVAASLAAAFFGSKTSPIITRGPVAPSTRKLINDVAKTLIDLFD